MPAYKPCVVLVPVASAIEPETLECLTRLMDRGYRVETLRGCSQVDLARAILATDAVRAGYSETMWIDSDVVFQVEDVERLRMHERPIACGLYPKKGKPEFAAKFLSGTEQAKVGTIGGLMEIEYAGFGFMHVRIDVFKRMESQLKLPRCVGAGDPTKEIVPYFLPLVAEKFGKWQYMSEDASFCERARKCGFPTFADTTIKVRHIGRYAYSWDDLTQRPSYDGLELTFTDSGKGAR